MFFMWLQNGFCELLKPGESQPEHGLLQKHAECKTQNGRDTQIVGKALGILGNSSQINSSQQTAPIPVGCYSCLTYT